MTKRQLSKNFYETLDKKNKKIDDLLQEIKELKYELEHKDKFHSQILELKNSKIKDLESNRNGCLQILNYIEQQIESSVLLETKIELINAYNRLLATYNRIEGE